MTRRNRSLDELRDLGYPEKVQPFELIDGPVGGGIILAHIDRDERWLPYRALTFDKGVDLSTPQPMREEERDGGVQYNVAFLEATYDPGWALATGKRRKHYQLGSSVEHIESMPDSIFWLIGFKPSKTMKEIRGLGDIPVWGEHFGLEVERLSELPEEVREETAHWLNTKDNQYAYFSVKGGGNGFGYHFAVAVYIGYHLCVVAGRRMRYIHLLSSIEGEPHLYSSHRFKYFCPFNYV